MTHDEGYCLCNLDMTLSLLIHFEIEKQRGRGKKHHYVLNPLEKKLYKLQAFRAVRTHRFMNKV